MFCLNIGHSRQTRAWLVGTEEVVFKRISSALRCLILTFIQNETSATVVEKFIFSLSSIAICNNFILEVMVH